MNCSSVDRDVIKNLDKYSPLNFFFCVIPGQTLPLHNKCRVSVGHDVPAFPHCISEIAAHQILKHTLFVQKEILLE